MFLTENAILIVMDVQGKLAHLMHNKKELFDNIRILIQAAVHLDIPILHTEQVPKKIGSTIPEIAKALGNKQPIAKSTFSCCGQQPFLQQLHALKRKQVIVTGIETHVCVYQTTADLMDLQYEVQVVADAVSSRTFENKQLGLDRIQTLGGIITSTEMIVCELLKTAEHEKFKDIINLI
jgi:nicotinamidase-related amidase